MARRRSLTQPGLRSARSATILSGPASGRLELSGVALLVLTMPASAERRGSSPIHIDGRCDEASPKRLLRTRRRFTAWMAITTSTSSPTGHGRSLSRLSKGRLGRSRVGVWPPPTTTRYAKQSEPSPAPYRNLGRLRSAGSGVETPWRFDARYPPRGSTAVWVGRRGITDPVPRNLNMDP